MQLAAAGWSRPATWEAVQALRRSGNALARHLPAGDRVARSLPSDNLGVSEHTTVVTRFRSSPALTH
jgi:hypothetical protein